MFENNNEGSWILTIKQYPQQTKHYSKKLAFALPTIKEILYKIQFLTLFTRVRTSVIFIA